MQWKRMWVLTVGWMARDGNQVAREGLLVAGNGALAREKGWRPPEQTPGTRRDQGRANPKVWWQWRCFIEFQRDMGH